MKEPNVLEAKNLCINGNPVDRPVFSDSEVYRIVCLFQPDYKRSGFIRSVQALSDTCKEIEMRMQKHAFERGTNDFADKYLDDNIVAARSDHNKACELYRNYVGGAKTAKERGRRINRFRCGGWSNENIKVDCLSGNYKKATFGYLVKAFIGKSWIDKLKKFFKGFIDFMTSDIGRHNPYDRMIKFPEPRNPPKSPPFRTVHGEKYFEADQPINFKELKPISGLKPKDFICSKGWKIGNEINPGQYKLAIKKSRWDKFKKWLKYWFTPVEPSPIVSDAFHENQNRYAELRQKTEEIDRIKRAQKLSYVLKKATRESELLGKALNRMRRRKKRYSISTPMMRKRCWRNSGNWSAFYSNRS